MSHDKAQPDIQFQGQHYPKSLRERFLAALVPEFVSNSITKSLNAPVVVEEVKIDEEVESSFGREGVEEKTRDWSPNVETEKETRANQYDNRAIKYNTKMCKCKFILEGKKGWLLSDECFPGQDQPLRIEKGEPTKKSENNSQSKPVKTCHPLKSFKYLGFPTSIE